MNVFQTIETDNEEVVQYSVEELSEAASVLSLLEELSDTIDKKGVNLSIMMTLESIESTLPEEVPLETFTKEPSLINIARARKSVELIRNKFAVKLGNA